MNLATLASLVIQVLKVKWENLDIQVSQDMKVRQVTLESKEVRDLVGFQVTVASKEYLAILGLTERQDTVDLRVCLVIPDKKESVVTLDKVVHLDTAVLAAIQVSKEYLVIQELMALVDIAVLQVLADTQASQGHQVTVALAAIVELKAKKAHRDIQVSQDIQALKVAMESLVIPVLVEQVGLVDTQELKGYQVTVEFRDSQGILGSVDIQELKV